MSPSKRSVDNDKPCKPKKMKPYRPPSKKESPTMNRTTRSTVIAFTATLLLAPPAALFAADAPQEAMILTPKPGPAPRINGPKVYGCRPGHPFLYRLPCTGERPMQFTVRDLPAGLKLDIRTGIITGTAPERGEYQVAFQAMNRHGKCERGFKIVAGDRLALTPPMGFNDWYAYYDRVTDADMRFAADSMISNGMADAGYQYVNVVLVRIVPTR